MNNSNPEVRTPATRSGRRGRKSSPVTRPATLGLPGGGLAVLGDAACRKVDEAARRILSEIGFAEAPASARGLVGDAGGYPGGDRLVFPPSMIDDAIASLARPLTLHGLKEGREVTLGTDAVHIATGGAAPMILDHISGDYRETRLNDIYHAARLVDQLDHIHFFSRPMVARDMLDIMSLDLNTAYACLKGTGKPVSTAVTDPLNLPPIVEMVTMIAGSEQAFRERPFLSLNINHVTPPLRLSAEAIDVMIGAARAGIPVHSNTFGQVGASSPVEPLAALAQTVAETLGGMIIAWLANPDAGVIFGARPMITDLRTGAMSGGSGEQARLMAASATMARFYGFPGSTIAGATDSKLPDAQAGYEKALTVLMAAQAGSNLITQGAGMQASLMGCALENYVIDNDMAGAIMRSLDHPQDFDVDATLASISGVVTGEGHFLGEADTLARMQSDYLYPDIADRRSIEEWQIGGSGDIRIKAQAKVTELLANPAPDYIPPDVDQALNDRFDLKLNPV